MLASDLLSELRLDLGDPAGTTYSDYQLMNSLNSVLRLVNISLQNISSSLIKKATTLTLTGGTAPLPDGFLSIYDVAAGSQSLLPQTGSLDLDDYTYRIIGNQIYANYDALNIIYLSVFTIVQTTDVLPVPDVFAELLKRYTKVFLAGGIDTSTATILPTIQSETYMLVASRERTKIVRKPSFYV